LNLTAKEIITINVNGANVPNPIPIPREIMADKLASSSPSSTPVVAGEQTVSASVTLQIRY